MTNSWKGLSDILRAWLKIIWLFSGEKMYESGKLDILIIFVPWRLRLEDCHEFKAALDHVVSTRAD